VSRRRWFAVAVVVSTAAVAGCGGEEEATGIPAELVGTYATTLEDGDLPADAPMELVDGGPSWKLTVSETGGPVDGPALIIDSADEDFGNLEAPALRVEGDRLFLDDEECFENGSYVFYDNEYAWALEGSTLTITEVANQCRDEIASTILTSGPWIKTG
jgi:hypothetical protein